MKLIDKECWIAGVMDDGDEQIKLELDDYWEMMKTYSKVLDLVTNGKMSKTNYTYEAIKECFQEAQEENEPKGSQ